MLLVIKSQEKDLVFLTQSPVTSHQSPVTSHQSSIFSSQTRIDKLIQPFTK
ncbi:hypothetical protein [Sphaerospermopsis reniformis]|uniref:hypothetical protein n=1 Tax=Sphaerospermopsis reniformis TaxID=531300 RepID=UPI0013968EE7|nr:hypothetical protein [Sphaerospermopsis reniformis]